MEKNQYNPLPPVKLGVKIAIYAGIFTVIGFAAGPFTTKYKPEIQRGFITNIWMVPAHNDVRLRDPINKIWEQAWLDTMYFMEIKEVNGPRRRTVEIHKSMMAYYVPGEFVELADSAEYAAQLAKAMESEKVRQETRAKHKTFDWHE